MSLQTVHDLRSGWETQLFDVEAVQRHWPAIKELLERVPHTWEDFTLDSLLERALSGLIQVWGVGREKTEGVIFTQVVAFPQRRVLQIFWACGEGILDSADVVDGTMDAFARAQGCERIDILGRVGWEKFAVPRGFKRSVVILSRPVLKGSLQ